MHTPKHTNKNKKNPIQDYMGVMWEETHPRKRSKA